MSRFFFNDRKQLVNDAIEGILLSAPHANLVKLDIDPAIRIVARGDWDKSRVAQAMNRRTPGLSARGC